jgi:toxin CptA
MHQAPPVEYPLGNSRFLSVLFCAAWCAVLVVDLLWLLLADTQGMQVWLGLALSLLCGAMALRMRVSPLAGTLHWDGGAWSWLDGAHGCSGEVTVHLDLQSALLVAWTPGSGDRRWCWLDSSADPSRWLALRRALYSPRRAVPGHGDVPEPGSGVHA